MFRPLVSLRPLLCACIKVRCFRPTIEISKDRFRISIDVSPFCKEEIRVKARPEYVVIEGKQERKLKNGYVKRQFIRKFSLPEGCDPENMTSKYSNEGILTITANRMEICAPGPPCETVVPVKHAGPMDEDQSLVNVEDSIIDQRKKCSAYMPKTRTSTVEPSKQSPENKPK